VLFRSVTTGPLPLAEGFEVAGFGPSPLHRPEVEATCRQCHALDVPDAGPAAPLCASCHAEVLARRVMHGPVQQGACLACHQASSAPARFAVRWPIQDTCFSCHVDVKAAMTTKAFRHGPAAAGRCTTCHDPHGSEQPFWLKKHAYDLCTNCHSEKRGERHVVVGFVYGDSHPLRGRPHPLKERTEFSCPACHNPHAAQARFLWQFDVTSRESLCRTCHQK
jgi:predicted CXXCH cytochrome family protein